MPKSNTSVINERPLPSADLITYRFDRVDSGLAQVSERLDNMSQVFVPRAEIMLMHKEQDERIASVQRECVQLTQAVRNEALLSANAIREEVKITNSYITEVKEGRKWTQRTAIAAILSAVLLAIASLIVSLIAHRVIG